MNPFAHHAAGSPIETIVIFFVLGTLAYFRVLAAIKQSTFFAPTYPTTLRPAFATLRGHEWLTVPAGEWYGAPANGRSPLELQQIMFSLDSPPMYRTKEVQIVEPAYTEITVTNRNMKQVNPTPITLDLAPLNESILEFTHHLAHEFVSGNGQTYSSVCHRPVSHIGVSNTSISGPCFTSSSSVTPRTTLFSMSFIPDSRDEFVRALNQKSTFGAAEDLGGVRYHVESREIESIGEMKSGKWIAYAARALVMRFWDLLKASFSKLRLSYANYLYAFIESGLVRHSPRASWLSSHACNIHAIIPRIPRTWIQLLAHNSYHVIVCPGFRHCATSRIISRNPLGSH